MNWSVWAIYLKCKWKEVITCILCNKMFCIKRFYSNRHIQISNSEIPYTKCPVYSDYLHSSFFFVFVMYSNYMYSTKSFEFCWNKHSFNWFFYFVFYFSIPW